MKVIQQASAAVDRVCLTLAKLALVAMVLTVLLQIWARYGFDFPFTWTEELARYLMIWAGLLGATCAFKRKLDPRVITPKDTGTGAGADAMRWLRLGVSALAIGIFLLPVLYYSFYGPNMNFERGFMWRSSNRFSPGLGINMALVGSVVPLSCGIILLHLIAQITERNHR